MSAAERAFRDLAASGLIHGESALRPADGLGDTAFECDLSVPQPNDEKLPALVRVRVRIPAQFPESKVEFTPLGPEVDGFPHQDGRTKTLCLLVAKYPPEPSERLRAYVQSAIDWLDDAANGRLLIENQPWELPDFRVERKIEPPEVLTLEDDASFAAWAPRIGQFGMVQFVGHRHGCGLVSERFLLQNAPIHQAAVGQGFADRHTVRQGAWVLLPSHIVYRHRAARSFDELAQQCAQVGVDLWGLLRQSVRGLPYQQHHFLLVGAPIPLRVGAPASRIHWQPLAIAEGLIAPLRGQHLRRNGRVGRAEPYLRLRLRSVLTDAGLPWGLATAYPPDTAERRGSLSIEVKQTTIAVLGCGALGSLVAEHLARGGGRDISLFDSDTLELANLSRHPLSPIEVRQNKAVALARRLNGIHPLASIRGYRFALPPRPVPAKCDRPAWDILSRAQVLIDCTSDSSAFSWASRHGRSGGRLVLHLFINSHARMLTLCASGRHVACTAVARLLFDDIVAERTGFTVQAYEGDAAEELFPVPGCWHPTFPALGSNIAALVAASMPTIERLIVGPRASRGFAVVLRRNEIDLTTEDAMLRSLIDVAWSKSYR
jgi:ThiF family protein